MNRRRTAMPAPLPFDVRLMNSASALLAGVFVLMVLVLVVAWLARQSTFNLQAIQVQGDLAHNNAVTLRANVAPKLTGNFFTVDLTQTRTAFESVPWVRRATVQREFPNQLKVVLQEHKAVAYWGDDSETRLINNFGEVFEANPGDIEADDLPLLGGPDGQAPLVLAGYHQLAPLFDQVDSVLEHLLLTHQGSWRATLDSGAVIEIGHGSLPEITARVQRFLATLTQASSQFGRNLESADLRYESGYAIRLKGVTTTSIADKDMKKKR